MAPAVGEAQQAVGDEDGARPDHVIDDAAAERLVSEVMSIQRRFGHAMRNAQSDRRDQVREAIDRAARGTPS